MTTVTEEYVGHHRAERAKIKTVDVSNGSGTA